MWTDAEVARLKTPAKRNTPMRIINLKLQRMAAAVQSKTSDEGARRNP